MIDGISDRSGSHHLILGVMSSAFDTLLNVTRSPKERKRSLSQFFS
jgi:hypothetical protein